MSDAEHTPGPWFVTKDYYNGMRISTVPTDASNIDGSGSVFENTGRGAGDISEEDAKYIVQCVNSHDTLLEACKKLIRMHDDGDYFADGHFDPESDCPVCNIMDEVKAAIAQAEKEE